MSFADLLLFVPLMVAISVVVGAAGRPSEQVARSIRNTFFGLTLAIVAVGVFVRLVVILFA